MGLQRRTPSGRLLVKIEKLHLAVEWFYYSWLLVGRWVCLLGVSVADWECVIRPRRISDLRSTRDGFPPGLTLTTLNLNIQSDRKGTRRLHWIIRETSAHHLHEFYMKTAMKPQTNTNRVVSACLVVNSFNIIYCFGETTIIIISISLISLVVLQHWAGLPFHFYIIFPGI